MPGHEVVIINRQKISLTAIKNIILSNSREVTLETEDSQIRIEGEDLLIQLFDAKLGEINIAGRISGLHYVDKQPAS
jgi:sporulation protein YabP